jgi:hypothetical protein
MRLSTLAALAVLASLAGQAAADPGRWRPPRHAWGAPDLEGLWTNASITELERPPAFKALIAGEAEAAAYERGHPGVPASAARDATGQGTSEWWEMGGRLGRIAGQPRTSWIVDPADGQLPYSAEGRRRLAAARAAVNTAFDGPEVRPAPERCLAGIGGASSGPLLNSNYNSNLQIVQTPDHVVITLEMNHDARIIPLTPQPAPPGSSWTGHSVGHFEGDTLVVETSGYHPALGWRQSSNLYLSPSARITERFTRTGPGEILYAFTVDDPVVFSRPWRAEMPFRATQGPIFEFACHEGNYAVAGALAGARAEERAAATAAR